MFCYITDDSQLTMTVTVKNPQAVNASDFAVVLLPNFTNGRSGLATASGHSVNGISAGLRKSTLRLLVGEPVSLSSPLIPPVHLMVGLSDKAPVVFSTKESETPASVLAKTASYRKTELATLTKYGDWADVKDAVQTSLMWSLVYDPKQSLVAPSYGFTNDGDFEPSTPISYDGDTADNIFEWDQSFCGYMYGLDALGPALSNIFAVLKMKTAVSLHRHACRICCIIVVADPTSSFSLLGTVLPRRC